MSWFDDRDQKNQRISAVAMPSPAEPFPALKGIRTGAETRAA
jgi:hypothetical protein